VTVTETAQGPGAADPLAPRLRVVDERLDAVAELVGTPDAQLAAPTLRRELDALRAELKELEALADLAVGDDPFAVARVAIAVRRERLGFIQAALAPGEGVAPEALAGIAPVPEAARTAKRVAEGDRASSWGRVLSIVGLVLMGFFAYQLTGAALVYERSQRVLLQEFEEIAPLQAADPNDLLDGGAGDAESGLLNPEAESGEEIAPEDVEPEVIPASEAPARGEPIGILQIPALDVEDVVVQGSGPAELRSGPGHLRGTVMPGEPGNAAIAGSRIGGGAPFKRLQELEEGDPITVTTAVGGFDYEVRSVRRVSTGDPDPVRVRGGGSTLTLVTSTPKFLAYDRLVVVAELQTRPVAPRFSPVTPDRAETGFDTAPGGLAPLVIWGAALALAVVGARWLYRRWTGPVAYLLTTPVFVALTILVFESLAGVVPATF
jgi:LPXTG-site transpeptidase (sortase) family protein